MTKSSISSLLSSPVSGVTAALLIMAIFAGQRAEAMSPINPGMSEVGWAVANKKAVANERTIEVRGGHGGGGGGGGSGGGRSGGWGGGRSAGVSGATVFRGGAIGAAPAVAGTPRFAGHGFGHRRHFGGVFVGGYYDDYPYDYPDTYDDPPVYPAPVFVAGGGCRRVLTVHGPRVVCHHRAARHYHRVHRRHHHRRHHRA